MGDEDEAATTVTTSSGDSDSVPEVGNDVTFSDYALGATLTVLITFGTLFNCFVLVSIFPNRKLRCKVVNVLCCHLAIVGIIWCVVILPVGVATSFLGRWPSNDSGCNVFGFVQTLVVQLTVWTIVTLSWDKYRTIVSPLHHSTIAECFPMVICLGVIWTVSTFTAAFPLVFCTGFQYDVRTASCSRVRSAEGSRIAQWYSIALLFQTFYLPLIVLVYCYCHIFRIARWQNKRIVVMAAMVRVITLSVGVPITRDQAQKTTRQVTSRDRKASRTVCTFLGAFIVCFAPYGLTDLVDILAFSTQMHRLPVAIANLLLMASPTINAFIYGVRNRTLKESFRSYVRRKIHRKFASDFTNSGQKRQGQGRMLIEANRRVDRMLMNGDRKSRQIPVSTPGNRLKDDRSKEILALHDRATTNGDGRIIANRNYAPEVTLTDKNAQSLDISTAGQRRAIICDRTEGRHEWEVNGTGRPDAQLHPVADNLTLFRNSTSGLDRNFRDLTTGDDDDLDTE